MYDEGLYLEEINQGGRSGGMGGGIDPNDIFKMFFSQSGRGGGGGHHGFHF